MRCDELTQRVYERLQGLLDPESENELDRHLTGCAGCRGEARAYEQLWEQLGRCDEPVPSQRMRARLQATLDAYQERDGAWRRLGEWLWPRQPAFQAALALATLVVGLFVGSQFGFSSRTEREIQGLRAELQTISLSLLDHQSASQRLRAVQSSRLATPDDRVVGALLETVKRDPNVNVRLAAVDALAGLLERPDVGRGLLEALDVQEAPLMQATLADLLLAARVDGSSAAVRRMLQRDDVDPTVREHVRQTMGQQI